MNLTVTGHGDVTGGRRDMAVSREEALRCPEQRLNATERVRGLYSQADPFGEERNAIADDDPVETGEYLVDGERDPRPFDWYTYRLGPVTVAADSGTAEGSARAAAAPAGARDLAVVVCAGTNATVPTAVQACTRARITALVVRADSSLLDSANLTTALLLRPTRSAGPPAILRHLNRVVRPVRTVVVHDLTDAAETVPSVRIVTVYGKLDGATAVEEVASDEGFAAVAGRVAEHPRDAVMFAGVRPERAAAFARALREAGHRGARVAEERVLGGRFLAEAEGWLVGTAYADADPRTRAFAAAHRERHGHSPAPWAAEAYDAVRFAAHGLVNAGADGPSALRSELLRTPWQGITRRFSYDPGGQFYDADRDGGAFLYRISDGAARFVARADDIGAGG
ncbi:ABC transporter substrate-binding protein [Streptomyces sp. NPDC087226]|uniref:ABC transporter substrate-binding protein n=1 Tax=Streptomyces sp. NPDC087226 TaxID=3365771 RepID=UPI00381AA05F